jgi:hypothetical protein
MHAALTCMLVLSSGFVPQDSLIAQTADTAKLDLTPGRLVRVTTSRLGRQVGRLTSLGDDSLRIDQKGDRSLSFGLSEVSLLEVGTGTHSRTLKGMLIGFAIGAAVIGTAAYVTYTPCEGFGCAVQPTGKGESALILGGLGGILGGGIGALVGAAWRATRWEQRQLRTQ